MSLSQRAEDIERSFREYRELKLLKQPIKNTYLLTLTLITLVVVFAATWYGLSLAKGITVPIQQLAEGTREVAHGNWEVHIAGEGEDEIGTLVSAFNQMTGDLKKFNAELEERRRHMTADTTDGRRYVGADCTLDGKPATVCGRLNAFATVAQYPHGLRVEYAWPTVARIMASGGTFRS